MQNKIFGILFLLSCCLFQGVKANGTAALEQLKQPADAIRRNNRPPVADRLFVSEAIEKKLRRIIKLLKNTRLAWMFVNCLPNTLDTTVHYGTDENGMLDTFVFTGDIHAMWQRDSGAQVWPYLAFARHDPHLKKMLEGGIRRQFKNLLIDPYANAFN